MLPTHSWLSWAKLLFGLEILLAGCTHPVAIPTIPVPPLPERKATTGSATEVGRAAPRFPAFRLPEIDLAWLDSEGLLPPTAQIIKGNEATPRSLVITPRAAYPSSDVCKSPDDEWLLLNEAARRGPMIHTLHAFKRGEVAPTDIFQTKFAYDVLWSGNSRLVAVTEYTGRNESQIFFVNVSSTQKSGYVDVGPALETYFSEEQRSWERFQKTYRWSDSGIVIRGIAHAPEPPFDQIGYEVILRVDDLANVVGMGLIRGYIKHPKL